MLFFFFVLEADGDFVLLVVDGDLVAGVDAVVDHLCSNSSIVVSTINWPDHSNLKFGPILTLPLELEIFSPLFFLR